MTLDELLKSDVAKMYDIDLEDNRIRISKPNFISIPADDVEIYDNEVTITLNTETFCITLWKEVLLTSTSIF